MENFNIGRLSIEIPAECPDKGIFETVVREELQSAFGEDNARASFCKSEYDRCQRVPAEFKQNSEAENHYQRAQMALSPAAGQWAAFEESAAERFSDYNLSDGSGRTAAIPGWRLDQLQATVRERPKTQQVERQAGRERQR